MKDNYGITLIELIVVVMISGILIGGTAIGYSYINQKSTKNAAERMMVLMDYVRTMNMTKNKTYQLEIMREESSGNYVLSVTSTDQDGVKTTERTEVLKLEKGEVFFENNTDSEQYLISSAPKDLRPVEAKLSISYRKDTGGLTEYRSGLTVTKIGIMSAGRTSNIHLVAVTGKHYLD